MNKEWVNSIQCQLKETKKVCSKLPAGQRLEPEDLNKILRLFSECRNLFLIQCEFYGFKIEPPNSKN